MKRFYFLGRLCALILMLAFGSLTAMAVSNKDFYSKVTVKSTGNGKVYVSYKEKADAPEYADESTAESGADNKAATTLSHNYYLGTQPTEGYLWEGLYKDEECTEKVTTDNDGKFTVLAQTDDVEKATYTYYAKFVPAVYVDLTVTEAQYATFMVPFNASLPQGVKAYTVDGVSEENELVLSAQNIIPANTPVVLFSEEPVTETLAGISVAEETTYTSGLLTGVYAPVDVTDGYVLQEQDGKVAFYTISGEGSITVPANRAYLTAPASSGKALYFQSVDATAINAVSALNSLTSGKAEIFSINGAKLNKLQKGINIVNGTKVVVK